MPDRLLTPDRRDLSQAKCTPFNAASGEHPRADLSVAQGVVVTSSELPEVERLLALDTEELINYTVKVERDRSARSKGGKDITSSYLRASGSHFQSGHCTIRKRSSKLGMKTLRRKKSEMSGSITPPRRSPTTRIKLTTPGSAGQATSILFMEAALRRTSHGTRLIRSRLNRAMGNGPNMVTRNAARSAISFILTEGATHGDLDPEKAILLSSSAPYYAFSGGLSIEQHENSAGDADSNGDAMGRGKQAAETPSISEGKPDEVTTGTNEEGERVLFEKRLKVTHEKNRGPDNQWDDQLVVDRERLITILTAHERVNAMANHLGLVETPKLDAQPRYLPPPKAAYTISGSFETPLEALQIKSHAAVRFPSINTHLARLVLEEGDHPNRGEGSMWDSSIVTDVVNGPAITNLHRGRKRRRAADEEHGEGTKEENQEETIEVTREPSDFISALSRFSSRARYQKSTIEPRGGELMGTCPSLPKLKVFRPNGRKRGRDEFDRFGGRETPRVLCPGSLIGGGEHTKGAILELRRQLAIAKGGLMDLRALVRADVAWVQETVGGKMPRRAKEFSYRWGLLKIAEITRRWEERSLAAAMTKWVRHHEFIANKVLVKAFLKRKGAAMTRRLLEMWSVRRTLIAIARWRRKVRLQRRIEQAAAAKTLQRIARGALGRRIYRRMVENRNATIIQSMARKRAGSRRAARIRDLIERNAGAAKIQLQARKYSERRRAQRIAALKKCRLATIKIQKTSRGFLGRQKAQTAKQDLLRHRACIAIQATWRALVGRRKAELIKVEAMQEAAVLCSQIAQQEKAARLVAQHWRRTQALKRRQLEEKAATAIQNVVKGRAARVAAVKATARKKETQRIAAAVHIQRIARGREARRLTRGLAISHRASITPKRPISSAATPSITPVQFREDGGDIGVDDMTYNEGNKGEAESTIAPSGDLVCNEVVAEGRGEQIETLESGGICDTNKAARGNAEICIQAASRGMAARVEAHRCKCKRLEEETRRAGVWGKQGAAADSKRSPGQQQQGSTQKSGHPNVPERERRQVPSDAPKIADRRYSQSVVAIQAVFRGRRARGEVRARRLIREKRVEEARTRAKEKEEWVAAIKIQTQSRVMAAKKRRILQRARHAARVGSIRESGQAAAGDLRALSRLGTTIEPPTERDTAATFDDERRVLSNSGAEEVLNSETITGLVETRATPPVVSSPSKTPRNAEKERVATEVVEDLWCVMRKNVETTLNAQRTRMAATESVATETQVAQIQLQEEETKRLEAQAAWEARQAEEDARAREELRAGIEGVESLKRQMEEDKMRQRKEQELWMAELHLQMDHIRVLKEKADEQERIKVREKKSARGAEAKAKVRKKVVVQEGANLTQSDSLRGEDESNEGVESSAAPNPLNPPGRGAIHQSVGDSERQSAGSPRPGSTRDSQPISRESVEDSGARETHAAAESRLNQVEAALCELEKKQEDLERREKAPEETRGEMAAPATSSATAVAGAESPESKRQSIVTASSIEEGCSSGTTSSSKEAPLLAPQTHSDSEAMDSDVPPSDGGPEVVEYRDESPDASYFYNTVTQEASWTNPRERSGAANDDDFDGERQAEGGGVSTVSLPEGISTKWTKCLDETSGAVYYYNDATGESTWERPADLPPNPETETDTSLLTNPEERVEAALRRLTKKQEDLEQREKEPEETLGEMVARATSCAAAVAGAGSPESKHQSAVIVSSTEEGGNSGTRSSSKEAPLSLLAPQEHSDSEATDGIVAPSDGGPEVVEYWDENADASYFYNTVTQEASWTNPREASGEAIDDDDGGERQAEGDGVSTVSLPENISTKWVECFNEISGAVYYYNDAKGESTWERPADLPPNTETETGAFQLANPEERVEAAIRRLTKKQEDLEQREKAPEEIRGEMAAPATSSAAALAGAESPESKRQSVVTASSPEKVGSSGTTSSSKEAPLLAPQEQSDSEAMDGIVAPSDGGPQGVEHWNDSADASYFYNTVTQEPSWKHLRDRSGATIDDDDGDERQAERGGASTVSLPEHGSTKQKKCFDETSEAVYCYNDATGESAWGRPADLPFNPETETGVGRVQAAPSDGGPEWVEYRDESADASYFYNTVTREASGTNPRERSGVAIDDDDSGERQAEADSVSTVSLPEDVSTKWIGCFDETSGAVYYYNDATGESTWERPVDLPPNPESETGVSQLANPEEWVCFLDETSGEEYWFNVATGETRWGLAALP